MDARFNLFYSFLQFLLLTVILSNELFKLAVRNFTGSIALIQSLDVVIQLCNPFFDVYQLFFVL